MPDDEGHPLEYEGLHAFVFIDQMEPGRSPADVVDALWALGKPPVMYASTFVGDFVAFAHVQADDLSALQDLIERDIWNVGVRCSWGIEDRITTRGAKRKSPGLIALTRIKVQPGLADEARARLVEDPLPDGLEGASVITGEYDVLLQMSGTSIEDAKAKIQSALGRVDGVMRTSTAFADGDRTERLRVEGEQRRAAGPTT